MGGTHQRNIYVLDEDTKEPPWESYSEKQKQMFPSIFAALRVYSSIQNPFSNDSAFSSCEQALAAWKA